MQISEMKPIHVFAEIERVDEDARTVEAYAFVNEVVEGEGGIRLKRSAMEEATGDYLKWANVRRMHQADAVGVAHSVEWDARGARMVLEVVDDDAWNKVRRGVYKGLSVGVQATLMRGKDVEKCRWIETSLVDRPKDPGAVILAVRVEDLDREAGDDSEAVRRHDASGALLGEGEREPQDDSEVVRGDDATRALRVEPVPDVGVRGHPDLRVARLELDLTSALARAEAAEGRAALMEDRLQRAEARVRVLESMPARAPVAKFGVAVDRSFLLNEGSAPETALREELQRLSSTGVEMTYAQRQAAAARISAIRRELGAGV